MPDNNDCVFCEQFPRHMQQQHTFRNILCQTGSIDTELFSLGFGTQLHSTIFHLTFKIQLWPRACALEAHG